MNKIWKNGLNLGIFAGTVLFQLGWLSIFYFTTWQAVVLCFILYCLTAMSVTLGYHRLITHFSFETYKPIKWLIAVIAGLSGEGSAIFWVATHRKHHAFADKEGDPHSPNDGKLWSHMLWFLPANPEEKQIMEKYAPDLWKDGFLRWQHYLFVPFIVLSVVLLYCAGWYFSGHYMACSFVAWGFFFRTFLVEHATWFVNSATHIWGYRNYETADLSTNSWWVALLTFGEGWHNNHHAFPRMARHGHFKGEIDITYMVICLMEKLGLAWNVIKEKHK